ncbi:MAG: cupredoxin domain-containing protein, partial [Spongiibacteraceae bacterium]
VLTAVIGDEITWINHDGSNHIISIDGQKSPRLGHDASYTWTANRTGTIPYECAIHGKRMKGEIIVGNPK